MSALAIAPSVAASRRRTVRLRDLGRRTMGVVGLAVALVVWQLAALQLDTVIFPTFTSSLAAVGTCSADPH